MFDVLRTVKGWQVAVLAALIVAALGGTYGGYLLVDRDGDAVLGQDQQLIPVQRGDLVNEVSVNGSLIFPNRETLVFGTQGSVGRVMVEEGVQVTRGEPLVALDEEAITGLEKSIAEARVALRDAEDALADLTSPATALSVAHAEAAVADARLAHTAAADALAELFKIDQRDVAQAELGVTNAEGALEDAREALDTLAGPPTAEAVAEAESAVAVARLSLEGARDSLDTLLSLEAEDVVRAESLVADARVALRDAGDSLDGLLNPTTQQIADAEAAITRSRVAVDAASEALRVLNDGPDADAIAQANADVDSAQTALADERLDLELVTKQWDSRVEAALESEQTLIDEYRAVFREWLGAELTDEEIASDPGAILSAWGADLAVMFGPSSRFSDLGQLYSIAGFQDDPATSWDEAVVATWVNFYPGAISTACDDIGAPFQGLCIEQQMDGVWDSLVSSRDSLDVLELEVAKALSVAGTAVSRAEDTLNASQDAVADLLVPSDPLDIEAAETDLGLAGLALRTAEEDLADLLGAPDAVDVDAFNVQVALAAAHLASAETDLADLKAGAGDAQVDAVTKDIGLKEAGLAAAEDDLATLLAGAEGVGLDAQQKRIALAEADLDKARTDLAELQSEADPEAVDASEKHISVTLAQLEQAEEDLQGLTADPEALDVSLRQADTAATRAALETALRRLDDAVITAPWDGIVSLLNVETGDSVNPNTPVLEIVDPTVVEVDGAVDEIDVLFISGGASASVTLDALPGQALKGTVSEVASEALSQQGVVSYPLRIRVQPPEGLLLPEGLTAVASVVIREERDVLLLPLQALYGTFDEPVVLVTQQGNIRERPVILGNSDDFWVVIESGLAEGDQVVWQAEQVTTTGAFGGFGGGSFRSFRAGVPGGDLSKGALKSGSRK